ncbi:hypothetical protein DPMN_056874 [Dreissena polymorpha]|uniref:Uncharacterized protein n=1 Tax=Dreissena polymorpha TaxID=45954 RepID=A0A9D4CSI5_DREPO|nr:hypothetical protein DPMN_056874 [Dreissena polymorpha]
MKKHDKNLKDGDFKKSPHSSSDKRHSDNIENLRFNQVFPIAFKTSLEKLQTDPMYNIFGSSSTPVIAKECQENASSDNFMRSVMGNAWQEIKFQLLKKESFFQKGAHV